MYSDHSLLLLLMLSRWIEAMWFLMSYGIHYSVTSQPKPNLLIRRLQFLLFSWMKIESCLRFNSSHPLHVVLKSTLMKLTISMSMAASGGIIRDSNEYFVIDSFVIWDPLQCDQGKLCYKGFKLPETRLWQMFCLRLIQLLLRIMSLSFSYYQWLTCYYSTFFVLLLLWSLNPIL